MSSTLDRLEKIARRDHEDDVAAGRIVRFRLCSICGTAEWSSSSDSGKGFKVEIEYLTDSLELCRLCSEAFSRSPELARWVLRVVSWRQEEKPKEEPIRDP